MKRFFGIICAVALVASMASCKKDYTCECTVAVPGAQETVVPTEILDAKKSEAEDACDQLGTVPYTTCELK